MIKYILAFTIFVGCAKAETSCRDFIPVAFNGGTICVSPDYYSIDGVRTPVGMSEALKIAGENDAFLPTPAMVDAIWEHADIQLSPITMAPGPQMTSRSYYEHHDVMIDHQIQGLPYDIRDAENLLIAGHKKDIVQPQKYGRVTIYGWHRSNGSPIQPVSSVHGSEYRDYSHGLRLVRYPQ